MRRPMRTVSSPRTLCGSLASGRRSSPWRRRSAAQWLSS